MKKTSILLLLAVALSALTSAQSTTTSNPNPNTQVSPMGGLNINTKAGQVKKGNIGSTKKTPKPAGNMPGTANGVPKSGTGNSGSGSGNTRMPGGGTGNTHMPGGGTANGGNTNTGGTSSSTGPVSQSDASAAIKQALINGITTGVSKVSVTNGYFGNAEIKIPLPQELEPVDNALRMVGGGDLVDKLVLQLNRSAEQAAGEATPIFMSSINQLTINDAVNIISNQQQDAATQFLKRTTTEQLVVAFKPKIKTILDQTKTNEIYGDVMNYYNKIPFVSPVNADLSDYVTRKALDGLFVMIAKEEAKIRQNPAGEASSILSRVFGSLLHK